MNIPDEQYVHTLIPDDPAFCPEPRQVAHFFQSMIELGAAPMCSQLLLLKPSGEVRKGTDSITGEVVSVLDLKKVALGSVSEIPKALELINHYDLIASGQGPSIVSPFVLWTHDVQKAADARFLQFPIGQTYAFDLACCVRPSIVSTSYWDDPSYSLPFGDPCTLQDRTGFFPHPETGALIRIDSAGCARFWIEFQFGKWLFPKINDTFDVLEPAMVSCAQESFEVKFVQGCHWA